MLSCNFTYSHYEKILELIEKTDYKVTLFNEAYLNDKELILRHDVDVDLEKAYRMALIENKYKIRATYFILMTSPFYNIFDKSDSDYIKGILGLGHQIGLHFDESTSSSKEPENILKDVDAEVQILKEFFDTNIFAVSFHRPSQLLLQSNIKLRNKLINTYDQNFFKGFTYISDSRHMWKEGCLCNFVEKAETSNSRIQALIHPIWWNDEALCAQVTMEKFLLKKFKYLDDELEKNIQIYSKLF